MPNSTPSMDEQRWKRAFPHTRHALAGARACESERDVRWLSEAFDEDHQVISLRVEIPDGRLARIAHAEIELAGGFIMRGARGLCDQHTPACLTDGFLRGVQQSATHAVAVSRGIDRNPVQVKDAARQIARTVTGEPEDALPIPVD